MSIYGRTGEAFQSIFSGAEARTALTGAGEAATKRHSLAHFGQVNVIVEVC